MNWKEMCQEMRDTVEFEATRAEMDLSGKPRECPECGCAVRIRQGRYSGKFCYDHPASNCIFDQSGAAIWFATREEAEQAEVIFEL